MKDWFKKLAKKGADTETVVVGIQAGEFFSKLEPLVELSKGAGTLGTSATIAGTAMGLTGIASVAIGVGIAAAVIACRMKSSSKKQEEAEMQKRMLASVQVMLNHISSQNSMDSAIAAERHKEILEGLRQAPLTAEQIEQLAALGSDEYLTDIGLDIEQLDEKLDQALVGISNLLDITTATSYKIDDLRSDVKTIGEQIGGRVRPETPPVQLPPLSPRILIRSALLDDIKSKFGQVQIGALRAVCLHALGGYGKTTVALSYAYANQPIYTGGIFFFSLESQSIDSELARIAPALNVPAEPPETLLERVKQALAGERSLLVLDNVHDVEHWNQVKTQLPGGNCEFLVTTRADNLPQLLKIKVSRLTSAEARGIYAKFCPERTPNNETADALTELVGGLAVAVAAIGALINLRPSLTWESYLGVLQNTPVENLPDALPDVQAELGINEARRALAVIDSAIEALSPMERDAVRFAAILPRDMAPRPWLETLLRQADSYVPSNAADPNPSEVLALDNLERLDVLISGDDERLLRLHPLWRDRVFLEEVDKGRLRAHVSAIVKLRLDVVVGDDEHLPHCLAQQDLRWELGPLEEWATLLDGHEEIRCEIEDAIGLVQKSFGQFDSARVLVRRALAARKRILGPEHPHTLTSMINLAGLLWRTDGYNEAEPLLRSALRGRERVLGLDHRDTLAAASKLAGLLVNIGQNEEAELLATRTLESRERVLGIDHPDTLRSVNNLACLWMEMGRVVDAERLNRNALLVRERDLGPDHLETIRSVANLAQLLRRRGKYSESEILFRRALQGLKGKLGSEHLDTLHVSIRFGYLLLEQNRHKQGLAMFCQAADTANRVLGPEHPTTELVRARLTRLKSPIFRIALLCRVVWRRRGRGRS